MTAISVTIGTDGGDDYSTFSAWQTGEAGDLTAAGQNIAEHLVSIGDDWASGNTTYGFQLSGWTTDATHIIKWQPQSGEGHGGAKQGGFFFKTSTSTSPFYSIDFVQEHIHLVEIEAENTTSRMLWDIGGNTTVHRCILHRSGTATQAEVIKTDVSQNNTITSSWLESNNCRIANITRGHDSSTVIKQNFFLCTGTGNIFRVDANTGFAWNATCENNMIHGDTLWTPTDEPTTQNNISYNGFKSGIDDTMGTNTVTGVVETTGTDYTDFTNEDFTPVDGGKLDNAGTTVGPSEDLEGNSWVTNDIGPLIAAVAAGGGPSAGSLSLMGMGI